MTVSTRDRQQEAYDILRRYNAYDWNSRMDRGAEAAGTANAYAPAIQAAYQTTGVTGASETYDQTADQEARKVQLREEQLTAQKQQVQTGEVGLHKDVVSEEQTLDVPVNREEVYIERKPVAGNGPSDTPLGQDETYRVPVREEQVQVNKQPVAKEEINIGKRVVQDNQQVSDTVRREEARFKRSGDVNVQGTPVDATNADPRYNDPRYSQDPSNPNNL